MSGLNGSYIDTMEDPSFRDKVANDGDIIYTRPFLIKGYGINGVLGLYIDCEGSGEFEVFYEVDPGEETGEPKDRVHEWFEPLYRNPLNPNVPVGKTATPLVVVISKFVRFKLILSGSATFKSLKLCYQ